MNEKVDGYRLIRRVFKRTLIHEEELRWFPGEEKEPSFRDRYVSPYPIENGRSYPIQSPHEPEIPRPGGAIAEFRRFSAVMTVFLDDLFWCPKCGTFSIADGPFWPESLPFEEHGNEIDYAALPSLIDSRKGVSEYINQECGPKCRCTKLKHDLISHLSEADWIAKRIGWTSQELSQFNQEISLAKFHAEIANQKHDRAMCGKRDPSVSQ